MAMAIALVLLAVGSIVFHVLSPWWWTPIASNWRQIDNTILITFWITGVAYTAILLFMAYCVFRFRHKTGARAHYEPENRTLEIALATGTTIGVAAMLAPGLIAWKQYVTPPTDASVVEAVGQQWQWSFRLPGADGKLGTANTRRVTADNLLGVDPRDPNARDDIIVIGGDLHLPIGKPVILRLRSIDVVHNFYVPEFRAKMDLMPGIVTSFWFTPTREGSFEILCAAFCGIGHAQMRGIVVIESEDRHRQWLGEQKTFLVSRISGRTSEFLATSQ